MRDINTDEELNRIELNRVSNIAVFSGKKINEIAWLYGRRVNDFEEYIMVQFDNCEGFFVGEKAEYISALNKGRRRYGRDQGDRKGL